MKFTIATILAFAAAVLGKPVLTNSNFDITEGEPFTLTWTDAQGPVTITLVTGEPGNLKPVTVLTSGETGSEFTWTPSDLPSGTYAIQIDDASGVPNYSKQFVYEGTGTLPSSSSSISSTVSRSSTSASVSSTSSSSSSSSSSESESTSTTSSEASSTTTFTTTTTDSPSTTRAPTSTSPPSVNNGQRFASPLALVLVTVAGLVFFN